MSFPTTIPQAILDTVLARLALLFLSGTAGDLDVARSAARQMLAGYHVRNEQELCLAAQIVGFGLHALEALAQASDPATPPNKVQQLRSTSVRLSGAEHRAQRQLDRLRRDRDATPRTDTSDAKPAAHPPGVDKAMELIESAREAFQTVAKSNGQTWTQTFKQRQTAKRIADNLKKNQARQAAAEKAA